MKTLTLVLLTFAFFLTSASSIYAGDNEKVTVNVPTIQCGTCKKNITKALNNLDGVTSVKIDMKKKTAAVTFDDSKTNAGAIEDAITAAGYDANDKKADHDAYERLDDCCKVEGMH